MRTARLVIASATLVFLSATLLGQVSSPSDEAFWRRARNCGPNSVYVLARALGYAVDYEKLCRECKLGSRGVSLTRLVEAAKACGLPARAAKGSPSILAAADEFVVAHMESYRKSRSGGHFLVVVDFNEAARKVRVFDGSAALYSWLPMDEFLRGWSGYVLTLPRKAGAADWALAPAFVGMFLLAGFFGMRRRA